MVHTHRVGLYAWGGPETVRLLKTKYNHPRVNEESFLHLYDENTLREWKRKFKITDAWVTYSWGFSDETEQEGYLFLRNRLAHFKKLGIHTHAYVQGLNLVAADFKDVDVFCEDVSGKHIPYSKGRLLTCPNNPNFLNLHIHRVRQASAEKVDGVFIDNIVFGSPPIAAFSDYMPPFGCFCRYCKQKFRSFYHYDLPTKGFNKKQILDYMSFRTQSVSAWLAACQKIVQGKNKEFGVNLYDPTLHTPELFFGYSLTQIEPLLSYLLIENHTHPISVTNGNHHLKKIVSQFHKPVFVVSYKEGIALERTFSQQDIEAQVREAQKIGFYPCIKASEFTTNGIWHTLDIFSLALSNPYRKPHTVRIKKRRLKPSTMAQRTFFRLLTYLFAPALTYLLENVILWSIAIELKLYQRQLKSVKLVDVPEKTETQKG
jgi:hypothetical protein